MHIQADRTIISPGSLFSYDASLNNSCSYVKLLVYGKCPFTMVELLRPSAPPSNSVIRQAGLAWFPQPTATLCGTG